LETKCSGEKSKKNEVSGQFRILHNSDLYRLPSIGGSLQWAGHRGDRNAYNIFLELSHLEIKHLEDQDEDRRITLTCISMEIGYEDRMLIDLAQDCLWLVL
jgi:hypothetical protein